MPNQNDKPKPKPNASSPLPDFDTTFVNDTDIAAFERAIRAPDAVEEDHFITVLNDWRPIRQRIRKKHHKRRGKDETREGFVHTFAKWPLLMVAFAWLAMLSLLYVVTRFYISQYEYWITWRGERNRLRKKLRASESYEEWKGSAKELDQFLGAEQWKEEDAFAYYDHLTVKRILKDLREVREKAEAEDRGDGGKAAEELRLLIEACVKNNFAGIESPRMYSQTHYGTKHLVQSFVDEVERCLRFLCETPALSVEEKRDMFKHLSSNYGRTALCLSGGACFSYYHFGVIKAHLDADLLPKIITGTSGGALVAALVCTRTDEELKQLLVPELADKITACHDSTLVWLRRWLRTGARFDSIDWALRCCWFTRGSMTFKEAYQRTGRILNISCVPSDPHTPSILLNYLTAPDCCIFSAVLASAAVPGILNPVVLMTKTRTGTIAPYSFGNKWKDGSLRTDIPIRSLNLYFNVNFSIVSQVNPHVNIFFFSSRGSVGRPVTHRRGKGWRGGFLGSAVEQYLKLDMAMWLKVLRHLELLPRPMSQDWSSVFLQKFDGTITLWPKTVPSDFWFILTDPTRERLERMLKNGQRCTYSKLKFVGNRLKIERVVEHGRNLTRSRSSEFEDSPEPSWSLPKRKKSGSRCPSVPTTESPSATTSGIAAWFPWGKSPGASFDAATEGSMRLRNGSAVGNGTVGNGIVELDGSGSGSVSLLGEGGEEGEEGEGGEEGWSSSSSSCGEGASDEWDVVEGRVVTPGKPMEKISAKGETVLGV